MQHRILARMRTWFASSLSITIDSAGRRGARAAGVRLREAVPAGESIPHSQSPRMGDRYPPLPVETQVARRGSGGLLEREGERLIPLVVPGHTTLGELRELARYHGWLGCRYDSACRTLYASIASPDHGNADDDELSE